MHKRRREPGSFGAIAVAALVGLTVVTLVLALVARSMAPSSSSSAGGRAVSAADARRLAGGAEGQRAAGEGVTSSSSASHATTGAAASASVNASAQVGSNGSATAGAKATTSSSTNSVVASPGANVTTTNDVTTAAAAADEPGTVTTVHDCVDAILEAIFGDDDPAPATAEDCPIDVSCLAAIFGSLGSSSNPTDVATSLSGLGSCISQIVTDLVGLVTSEAGSTSTTVTTAGAAASAARAGAMSCVAPAMAGLHQAPGADPAALRATIASFAHCLAVAAG